jgi:hypothetical protein
MLRQILTLSTLVLLLIGATERSKAAEFGTAEEAKAMLDKAVAAVKENKTKALANFNSSSGDYKDRFRIFFACRHTRGAGWFLRTKRHAVFQRSALLL